MATTESTQYAKFNTLGLTQRPSSIDAEGRIRFLNDLVTFEGGETAAAEVSCLPLPKGAKVDLSQSAFISPGHTGVSLHLGCNGSTNNLADGVSIATAGTKVFNANAVSLVEVTDGTLTLTVEAGTLAASDDVLVRVAYYVL